jgi:hypothetical protein
MSFTDVLYNEATDSKQGGVGVTAVIADIRDVASCPELPSEPATDIEYTEVEGNIVMKDGKSMATVELVSDKNSFKSELVGEKGNKFYKHTFTAKLRGDGPAQKKFMRLAANGQLLMLVPSADCDGFHYILGNCCNPASLATGVSNTGETIEDTESGNMLTFESYAYAKAPKPSYGGTIPLAPSEES